MSEEVRIPGKASEKCPKCGKDDEHPAATKSFSAGQVFITGIPLDKISPKASVVVVGWRCTNCGHEWFK